MLEGKVDSEGGKKKDAKRMWQGKVGKRRQEGKMGIKRRWEWRMGWQKWEKGRQEEKMVGKLEKGR